MQIPSDFEKLLLQNSLQLRYQLGSIQNRLNGIESELFNSKKQCLDLTEEINRLTRENIMLKSVKQTLERSCEENIDAIVVILNKREEDYHLVYHQNAILNKLRLYSRQLINEIAIMLERKNDIVQEITIENQELRMKLSNAYERLEQVDTQLLQHNDAHIKSKQRLTELNNKLKQYETIVCKLL